MGLMAMHASVVGPGGSIVAGEGGEAGGCAVATGVGTARAVVICAAAAACRR